LLNFSVPPGADPSTAAPLHQVCPPAHTQTAEIQQHPTCLHLGEKRQILSRKGNRAGRSSAACARATYKSAWPSAFFDPLSTFYC